MPSLLYYAIPYLISCLPILVYQIKLRLGIGPHTRFPLKNTCESVICGNGARIEQAIDCGVYIGIMLLTFLTHLTVRPANYLCRTKEWLMMSVRIFGSAVSPRLQQPRRRHCKHLLQSTIPLNHVRPSFRHLPHHRAYGFHRNPLFSAELFTCRSLSSFLQLLRRLLPAAAVIS